MNEGQRNGSSVLLNWLLGIIAALIIAGAIGIPRLLGSVADIQATIRENKSEREGQIRAIDARLDRHEQDIRNLERDHRAAGVKHRGREGD